MMIKNKKGLIQTILFLAGIVILGFFIAKSGIIENYQILLSVNIPLLIIALVLSIGTIFLKVYRWKFLSSKYSQEMSWHEASVVSISSLYYANITPGKIGDIFKAFFMQKRYKMNFGDGISMLFYERFFELMIFFFFAAAIVFVELRGITIIALEFTCITLAILLLFYFKVDFFLGLLDNIIVRLPFFKKTSLKIQITKLSFSNILCVFVISFVSIVLEFVRLWVVALAFGYTLNPLLISIFLSLSLIVGLVSQIPLGLGIMEGSLSYFITKLGVAPMDAMAIVLTDRVISMYFALFLGMIYSKYSVDLLAEVPE
jgi:uncharacterized protein (TIRG00374 family)